MKTVRYDKLVRDKIPKRIRASGDVPQTITLASDEDFLHAVLNKVVEEAKELRAATSQQQCIEELADLREIIAVLIKLQNLSGVAITRERRKKAHSHGRFQKRTLLLNVAYGNK